MLENENVIKPDMRRGRLLRFVILQHIQEFPGRLRSRRDCGSLIHSGQDELPHGLTGGVGFTPAFTSRTRK